MSGVIAAVDRLADAWVRLAWAVAWQSTLVVSAFAIAAMLMRRSSPGLRYGLWQVAAIKLLVMPLWGVAVALPSMPAREPDGRPEVRSTSGFGGALVARAPSWMVDHPPGALASDATAGSSESTAGVGRPGWPAWLLAGWGLAVVVQVAGIVRHRRRLGRFLGRTSPAEDPDLLERVAALSRRIGLRRPPEVRIADDAGSPFVCGLRRPTLVLPRGLARSPDVDSLRPVLLHELAHIRRRDLLWDWIPTIARVVYVFHPAAHYVAYRARLERELACDQAAMVLDGRDAAGYAATLIDVLSRAS